MSITIAQVEAIFCLHLCRLCAERRQDGTCGRRDRNGCVLIQRLPAVAKAITSLNDGSVGQYLQAIRAEFCATCPRRAPDKSCDLGDHVPAEMVIAVMLQPPSLVYRSPSSSHEGGPSSVITAVEQAIQSVLVSLATATNEKAVSRNPHNRKFVKTVDRALRDARTCVEHQKGGIKRASNEHVGIRPLPEDHATRL